MKQLPIFANIAGQNVVLVGEGGEADAKRRLIERAGGIVVADCPNAVCRCARLAFVALEDDAAAATEAARLRAKGMQVNVVDRPHLCDFTTPAMIDRDPVLIAVSTGGASAGMAKAIRQRLERILPEGLGALAMAMSAARDAIRARWPGAADRRRAIDAALADGGLLDPFGEHMPDAVDAWLAGAPSAIRAGLVKIDLLSNDPEDLTIRNARLLGEADHIFADEGVAAAIIARSRADAERHTGAPSSDIPEGLVLHLRLPAGA